MADTLADIWTDRRVKIGYETAEELAKHYNPLNFRGHPANQRDATEESLDALGYVGQVKKSLHSGVVLDGHLRIEIALAKDPTIQLPVDYYDLTPDEELLALQVLDTTTEMAQPIADKLAALMERTKHLAADKPGLAAMLAELKVRAGMNGNGHGPKDVEPQIDKAAELQRIWRTRVGQVWELGQHRLVCGDCTDRAVVEAVMRGEKAQAYIGDIPYGVTGLKWDAVIPFDIMWDMFENNLDKDAVIITTSTQPFTSALIASRFEWFIDCWVWNKKLSGNFLHAKRHPLKIHEDVIIFSGGDYVYNPIMADGIERVKGGNGKSKIWGVDRTCEVNAEYYPTSIIEIGNTNRISIEHPTPKPVELFSYLIDTYSNLDNLVCDFTLGSGTTLIACENLNRRCRAIEIDPGYCAVSIQRWVDLTGQQPRLISG